jgi:hypothetical protein
MVVFLSVRVGTALNRFMMHNPCRILEHRASGRKALGRKGLMGKASGDARQNVAGPPQSYATIVGAAQRRGGSGFLAQLGSLRDRRDRRPELAAGARGTGGTWTRQPGRAAHRPPPGPGLPPRVPPGGPPARTYPKILATRCSRPRQGNNPPPGGGLSPVGARGILQQAKFDLTPSD